jgi:rhodanese-related sulfurtransferase
MRPPRFSAISIAAGLAALAIVTAGCGGGSDEVAQQEPATETAAATPTEPPGETQTTSQPPSFQLEDGEFVPMDQVKQALDEGADFIILDTRVPEAYVELRIPGALSLPFYEVDERYQDLPKDAWIVAYCSCPTAEAEAAVEVLRSKGYDKTAVLLEGFPAWVDAGYPTTSGPAA